MGLRKNHILLAFLLLLFFACTKEAPVVYPESGPFSPLFPGSTYVTIPDYWFFADTSVRQGYYHMMGLGYLDDTTQKYIDVISEVPGNPVMKWNPTSSPYVMVGIFSQKIQINTDSYRISNPKTMVWAWNTGMNTGTEGNVEYKNGCDVIDGIIQYGLPPHKLYHDSTYYWAVWAWDNEALHVIYSSRQIRIHIE